MKPTKPHNLHRPLKHLLLILAHLYFPVQQLTGQNFKGAFARQTSQSAEERTGAGVPDHVTWVVDVQHFEIVVDGVADDNFTLQRSKNLEGSRGWT